MIGKDLLTLRDLSPDEMMDLIQLAAKFKKSPLMKKNALEDKTLALLFQKPSTRTRISFEVAMTHLGGYTLYLSPREIAMGERETPKDVACVISRYVDGIVARVFSHDIITTLARYADIPVINGLSDLFHPCQALGDMLTIREKVGSLKKATLAYVGDGNNVLSSLITICSKLGVNLSIATPKGYEPDQDVFEEAKEAAAKRKSALKISNDPIEAVKGADFVYTDVWVSMGQEDQSDERLQAFKAFQVNETLMRATGKDAYIMHCLPAHRGEEITDVIDGKNSIVYDQAENRMHVEKAVLLKFMGRR